MGVTAAADCRRRPDMHRLSVPDMCRLSVDDVLVLVVVALFRSRSRNFRSVSIRRRAPPAHLYKSPEVESRMRRRRDSRLRGDLREHTAPPSGQRANYRGRSTLPERPIMVLKTHTQMSIHSTTVKHVVSRMWTDAQRHGRPAEYRWRPLLNCRSLAMQ